jgi:hypothetical protein
LGFFLIQTFVCHQAAKKYKPFARETTFSVDFVLLQCILSASARKCFNPQTLLNDLKVAKRDEDNAEKEARRLRSAVEVLLELVFNVQFNSHSIMCFFS